VSIVVSKRALPPPRRSVDAAELNTAAQPFSMFRHALMHAATARRCFARHASRGAAAQRTSRRRLPSSALIMLLSICRVATGMPLSLRLPHGVALEPYCRLLLRPRECYRR